MRRDLRYLTSAALLGVSMLLHGGCGAKHAPSTPMDAGIDASPPCHDAGAGAQCLCGGLVACVEDLVCCPDYDVVCGLPLESHPYCVPAGCCYAPIGTVSRE